MARHSNGRMNWDMKYVWRGLRDRLIWGGVGFVTVAVVIAILEVFGT